MITTLLPPPLLCLLLCNPFYTCTRGQASHYCSIHFHLIQDTRCRLPCSCSSSASSSNKSIISFLFCFAGRFFGTGTTISTSSSSDDSKSHVSGHVECKWSEKLENRPTPNDLSDRPPDFSSLPRWKRRWYAGSMGPRREFVEIFCLRSLRELFTENSI